MITPTLLHSATIGLAWLLSTAVIMLTSDRQDRERAHSVAVRRRLWFVKAQAPQDAKVKQDNGRTYDFYRAKMRGASQRRNNQVSDLLVDGWSAYYRWLAELNRRLPMGKSARQPDSQPE